MNDLPTQQKKRKSVELHRSEPDRSPVGLKLPSFWCWLCCVGVGRSLPTPVDSQDPARPDGKTKAKEEHSWLLRTVSWDEGRFYVQSKPFLSLVIDFRVVSNKQKPTFFPSASSSRSIPKKSNTPESSPSGSTATSSRNRTLRKGRQHAQATGDHHVAAAPSQTLTGRHVASNDCSCQRINFARCRPLTRAQSRSPARSVLGEKAMLYQPTG